jgi:hypothetical protein
MTLRRNKSKKARAADALGTYLKVKTAGKAAKGAKKAAKGTAAYQVAKRTPIVKRVPLVLAGAAAAVFVAFKVKGGRENQPAGA